MILGEAVRKAERDREEAHTTNPISLAPFPVDPAILQAEREFRLSQQGGLQLAILVDNSEEEQGDISKGKSDGEDQRSVATIGSIAKNADFIGFD